jgi:signal transduction histidine kinase
MIEPYTEPGTTQTLASPAGVSRGIAENVSVAIFYILLAELGLAFGHPGAILVLAPAGIAVAAPLVLGFRVWPGLLLGAIVHGFSTMADPVQVCAIATGNVIEGLAVAWLIIRFANGRNFYERPVDIVKFAILGGVLSPLLAPPFGLQNSSANNYIFWKLDTGTLLVWWLGEMVSVLVLVPLLVAWAAKPLSRPTRGQVLEISLLLVLLIGVSTCVFTDLPPVWTRGYFLPYLCLPFPIWAAHRFGTRTVTLTTFAQGGIALGFTLSGHDLFQAEAPNQALMAYQGFTSFSAVVGLIVAAAVNLRRQAQEALQRAHDELDRRVEQRTQELQAEIDTRKAVEKELAIDIVERKRAQAQLRDAHDILDLRVRERTAELTVANQTLAMEIVNRKGIEKTLSRVLERLIDAQELERRRLSRELHDEVGQTLTGLKFALATTQKAKEIPDSVVQSLVLVENLADRLMEDVHRLAWELRPPALEQEDLVHALHRYTIEWAQVSGIKLDFHAGSWAERRLPIPVETTLYRVTQEALTNVLKHSKAHRVSVVLDRLKEGVSLIVEDDGAGFVTSDQPQSTPPTRHLGLLGMRERVAALGGSIEIESATGAGTAVYVRVPLKTT